MKHGSSSLWNVLQDNRCDIIWNSFELKVFLDYSYHQPFPLRHSCRYYMLCFYLKKVHTLLELSRTADGSPELEHVLFFFKLGLTNILKHRTRADVERTELNNNAGNLEFPVTVKPLETAWKQHISCFFSLTSFLLLIYINFFTFHLKHSTEKLGRAGNIK